MIGYLRNKPVTRREEDILCPFPLEWSQDATRTDHSWLVSPWKMKWFQILLKTGSRSVALETSKPLFQGKGMLLSLLLHQKNRKDLGSYCFVVPISVWTPTCWKPKCQYALVLRGKFYELSLKKQWKSGFVIVLHDIFFLNTYSFVIEVNVIWIFAYDGYL